jgi:hypothetical protein
MIFSPSGNAMAASHGLVRVRIVEGARIFLAGIRGRRGMMLGRPEAEFVVVKAGSLLRLLGNVAPVKRDDKRISERILQRPLWSELGVSRERPHLADLGPTGSQFPSDLVR